MQLIILNGPSSAGKTSLARELQGQLASHFLYFGIDGFMDMMPPRSNCWEVGAKCEGFSWQEVTLPNGMKGNQVISGPYGKQIEISFRNVIVSLVESGNNLIVDNVIDGVEEKRIWDDTLRGIEHCWVGVFCSLEKLLQREDKRPDRIAGSAAEQYYRTHVGIDYDISVDTGEDSVASCADKIIRHLGYDLA